MAIMTYNHTARRFDISINGVTLVYASNYVMALALLQSAKGE